MSNNIIDKFKTNLSLNTFIARKCMGYNHNELVKKSGLTRPVLSGIENAAINPTLETLIKLSVSLNIGLERLFLNQQGFEKIRNLLKLEFEKSKLHNYGIIIPDKHWRNLLKLSTKKQRSNYRHVIESIDEIVEYNYPGIDITLKKKMIYIATLGFIYQEDGFQFGIEFGIWLATHLF